MKPSSRQVMSARSWMMLIFIVAWATFLLAGNQGSPVEKPENSWPVSVHQNQRLSLPPGDTSLLMILDGRMNSLFVPVNQYNSILYADSVYWFRFRVENTSDEPAIFLETHARAREAVLFTIDTSGYYTTQRLGLDIPFRDWMIRNRHLTFYLKKPSPDNTYLVKIVTDYYTGMGLYPHIPYQYFSSNTKRYYFFGFFFGITFVAALYSLIFFLKSKERTYLFYSLYVLSFSAFAYVDWGLVMKPLSTLHGPWHKDLYTIPFSMMTIWLLKYAQGMLNTRNNLPVFHQLINAAVVTRVIIYLIGTTWQIDALYHPYIDNFLLMTAYIAGIVSWKNGYKPARYLILAFTVLFSGLIMHTLRFFGPVPQFLRDTMSMYNTGVIEILLFSLALADRFRILKKEADDLKEETIAHYRENARLKDNLNRELEEKVEERTRELRLANEQIQQMNQLLSKDNQKLQSDVKQITTERVMQKTLSFEAFKEIYPDDAACYKYLEKLKWEHGYHCIKCGNQKFSSGNTPFSRRCSKCNHIERVTSGTIFSHVKIPITKAFYILFLVTSGKNITATELSERVDLRRQTCWMFGKKILQQIENRKKKRTLIEGWSSFI